MALKITKPTDYGVDATYFKVFEMHLNFHLSIARVILVGYASKAARDAGKQPMVTIMTHFGVGAENASVPNKYPDFPFTIEGKNTKEAYDFIKTIPEWANAEDV